jgi:hypothetical protein
MTITCQRVKADFLQSSAKHSTTIENPCKRPSRRTFLYMVCKLCNLERDLCNSHILPEFLYKPLYDSKNRAHIISSDSTKRDGYIQKGFREPLLCEDCEQRFSRWENYAKREFFDLPGLRMPNPLNRTSIKVDYKRFRLFSLSLLWRMSICSLDVFAHVKLGSRHDEKLRQALLDETPLNCNQYPCILFLARISGVIPDDVILPTRPLKHSGTRCYPVLINGIVFCFFVGSHLPPSLASVASSWLNEKGNMTLSHQDARKIPFLNELITDFSLAIRKRRGERSVPTCGKGSGVTGLSGGELRAKLPWAGGSGFIMANSSILQAGKGFLLILHYQESTPSRDRVFSFESNY